MSRSQIVPLDPDRIDLVAASIARAFQGDPLQVYTLPDPDERARRSPAQFAALIRHATLAGSVDVTADDRAAALWTSPDVADPNAFVPLQQMPAILGDAWLRFGRVLDYIQQEHGSKCPARHSYLMLVGVDPDEQRQGIGAALLAPGIARADAAGLPCCLETSQSTNLTFYARLGFRVIHESVDPTSGVRFWSCQRDPR